MRARARTATVGVALAVALGLLGACSSGGGDGDRGAPAADAGGASPGADAAEAGGDVDLQAPPAGEAPRLVQTAEVWLRVEDPAAAAARAVEVAEAAGGTLDALTQGDDGDDVTVTVRVPAADFRPVLDDVVALGEVLDRRVDTDDVTDQVVDLDGRRANAAASVERLRQLYAGAEGIDQVVSIEEALTRREAELEGLAGQLRVVEDGADRSTVTVHLAGPEPAVRAVEEPDDDLPGFLDGLRTGWDVLTTAVIVVLAGVGFALPFLAPLALVGLPTLLVLRRRRRRADP